VLAANVQTNKEKDESGHGGNGRQKGNFPKSAAAMQ
jgi:hypothetical protein